MANVPISCIFKSINVWSCIIILKCSTCFYILWLKKYSVEIRRDLSHKAFDQSHYLIIFKCLLFFYPRDCLFSKRIHRTSILFSFVLAVLEFELRTWCLLGSHCTTLQMPPARNQFLINKCRQWREGEESRVLNSTSWFLWSSVRAEWAQEQTTDLSSRRLPSKAPGQIFYSLDYSSTASKNSEFIMSQGRPVYFQTASFYYF
jgi:hypothetical protein